MSDEPDQDEYELPIMPPTSRKTMMMVEPAELDRLHKIEKKYEEIAKYFHGGDAKKLDTMMELAASSYYPAQYVILFARLQAAAKLAEET